MLHQETAQLNAIKCGTKNGGGGIMLDCRNRVTAFCIITKSMKIEITVMFKIDWCWGVPKMAKAHWRCGQSNIEIGPRFCPRSTPSVSQSIDALTDLGVISVSTCRLYGLLPTDITSSSRFRPVYRFDSGSMHSNWSPRQSFDVVFVTAGKKMGVWVRGPTTDDSRRSMVRLPDRLSSIYCELLEN